MEHLQLYFFLILYQFIKQILEERRKELSRFASLSIIFLLKK